MSRTFVMMLLAIMSGSAAAGWVKVGDDTTDIVYADPSTIHRKGNIVEMWDLIDFKKTQIADKSITPYLSIKSHHEFDCKEEDVRVLSEIVYSGNMGRGQNSRMHSDPDKWTPVTPGSEMEFLWKFSCGKQH